LRFGFSSGGQREGTFGRVARCAAGAADVAARRQGDRAMKGILAWAIGLPIPIIILLYLFDVF
jgi:hypothetical protein